MAPCYISKVIFSARKSVIRHTSELVISYVCEPVVIKEKRAKSITAAERSLLKQLSGNVKIINLAWCKSAQEYAATNKEMKIELYTILNFAARLRAARRKEFHLQKQCEALTQRVLKIVLSKVVAVEQNKDVN